MEPDIKMCQAWGTLGTTLISIRDILLVRRQATAAQDGLIPVCDSGAVMGSMLGLMQSIFRACGAGELSHVPICIPTCHISSCAYHV